MPKKRTSKIDLNNQIVIIDGKAYLLKRIPKKHLIKASANPLMGTFTPIRIPFGDNSSSQ